MRDLASRTQPATATMRACPNCGGTRLRPRYREGSFLIVRCRDCGLVFLGNPPSEEDLYEEYHEGALREAAPYRADSPDAGLRELFSINEQRIAAIQALEPGGTLLDVGCGRGYFVQTAIDHGYQATGLDVSHRAADFARRTLGVSARAGIIEEAVRDEERYDVITLWHVLEHFLNPFEALDLVRRLLNDGGCCFIEVPNLHSLKFMTALNKWQGGNHPLYHRTFFTSGTLRRALRSAGFSQVMRLPLSYRVPGQHPAYYALKRGLNGVALDAFLTFTARK